MHKTGTQNNSCVTSGTSLYQCDIIEQSMNFNSMGSPSLQVAPDGTVGIAYYKNGAVRYAYPYTISMLLRPSNCGPGGNTWRCISVSDAGTIGPNIKLAIGKNSSERGIVFVSDTTMIDVIRHAKYVGSGGDCGADGLTAGLDPIFRWKCEDIAGTGTVSDIFDLPLSIDIDPEGYSVFAYKFDDKLWVSSHKDDWMAQAIDGNDYSDTGDLAAISVNNAGLGFIGYMQPTYRACGGPLCMIDTSPNLKVALQWPFAVYMPVILR